MHTIRRQLHELNAAFQSRIDAQERRYKRLIKSFNSSDSDAAKQKHIKLMNEADAISRAYRNAQLLVIETIRLSEWSKDELA
jgi:hypothetical protein